MITVTALCDFEPTTWTGAADAARDRARTTRRVGADVRAEAERLAVAWPDPVGQLAVGALLGDVASLVELAGDYDDGALVVDDATQAVTGLSAAMRTVRSAVQSDPRVSGPDEQGEVACSVPFDLEHVLDFLKARALAGQFTLNARTILVQAANRDREATIALMGMTGVSLPPSDDGPIDLSLHGIVLDADLNGQDRYGDCVTLASLIAIAHSDPGFVQQHIHYDPATGTYQVTLYDDGHPVVVTVDPRNLPDEGSGTAATNRPTWLSLYEQAIQQQFGDVKNGQSLPVPLDRITGGHAVTGPPPSTDVIRASLDQHPPALITVGTAGADEQPGDVDPAKRIVPGHAYTVRGVDAHGHVVLQNPWGPNGGYGEGGVYYPGIVHLPPDEYRRWFHDGAISTP